MRIKRSWVTSGYVSLAAAGMVAAALIHSDASANEAKADLAVQVKVADLDRSDARRTGEPVAVAHLQILVEARPAVRDVQLSIERPDGTTWTFKGHPFSPGYTGWTDPGGEPLEPGANGPEVPARGAILATIAVPLEGAAIHEILIKIAGLAGDSPLTASASIRIPVDVDAELPVEDGEFANFSLKGVR